VRVYSGNGGGPIFHWKPGSLPSDNMLSLSFGELMNAILSAIWRDLCVAGNKTVTEVSSRPPSHQNNMPSKNKRNKHKRKPKSNILILPTANIKKMSIRGTFQWATDEEREQIKRSAHYVRGHKRVLPPGHKPSDKSKELAAYAGIILPEGVTYVSPHARGTDAEEEVPHATPIYSKGLATLLSILNE
jgi:hypothetical protein